MPSDCKDRMVLLGDFLVSTDAGVLQAMVYFWLAKTVVDKYNEAESDFTSEVGPANNLVFESAQCVRGLD